MYEESLRMPFVIRYPKEIKGGGTLDDMVLNTDFASLFADYAGVILPIRLKVKVLETSCPIQRQHLETQFITDTGCTIQIVLPI